MLKDMTEFVVNICEVAVNFTIISNQLFFVSDRLSRSNFSVCCSSLLMCEGYILQAMTECRKMK